VHFLQRDKNKELEAKNRELDRKLKEETVLREKAEARCVEFRKKLRTLTSDASATTQEQASGAQITRKDSVGPNGVASNEKKKGVAANGTGAKSGADNVPAKPKSPPNSTAQSNVGIGATANKPPAKQSTNVSAAKPQLASNNGAKLQLPSSAGRSQSTGTITKAKVGDQTIATKSVPAGNSDCVASTPAGSKAGASPTKATPAPNQRGTIQSDAAASRADPQTKHVRSGSNESAPKEVDTSSKPKSDAQTKPSNPVPPNVSKGKITQAQRRPDNISVQPTPPSTPQQRPPPVSRARTVPHPRAASLNDFDPLGPNATSNMEGDVVPIISFPTNISLGAVPTGSTASYYQHSNGQTYSPTGAAVPEQFDQVVVPITTFGMATSDPGGSQQYITNSFQMQQPFMLQQPIMFQQVQGGVHQWAPTFDQQAPANSQQFYQQQGYAHQLQQQQQHQQLHQQQQQLHQQQQQLQQQQNQQQHQQQQHQQQQQQPSNPFDPFAGP
jgi:hypothetical protein